MAGLFQPKRVQVPGLLSDEGLSVALKNLSDTTKAGAEAAPPNTSAIDAANQITTEALKPQPTVKTAAPRVPGVELSAGAEPTAAAPADTRIGFGGTVTGFDVGKAIVQAGTLTPEQGEADRAERAAQAGAEAEVATGELAEKTDLLTPDEREAIGLPPLTPEDTMRLSSSIAQEQQIVKDKQERAKFIKEGPPSEQAEWLNIAQVSTRSAIQMGVGTLRYPADIWDTLAAVEKGSDAVKKSEASRYLDNVDKALTAMMPGDKTRSKDFTTKLAAGGGSMVGFMVTGWVGRAVGLPAWLTTGTLGAAVEGDSLYQEADTFGATATQKLIALFAGSGLGLTEAVPIDRAFMRADTASGGMIRNLLANTTSTSLEEFIQEASQSLGEDIIAKYGAGYDPKREISIDKALENGLIGAIVGGTVGGATTLLSNGQPVEHLTQDEAKITETVDAALAEEQSRFASIIGDEAVDSEGTLAAPTQGAGGSEIAGGEAAPTGPDPVRGDAVQQIVENQAAFHGTPHKFDKFSMEKIGTGEGAQAFGHGLYFAGERAVAEGYRKALAGTGFLRDGASTPITARVLADIGVKEPALRRAITLLNAHDGDVAGVIDGLVRSRSLEVYGSASWAAYSDAIDVFLPLGGQKLTKKEAGALYQVDIPDDAELLDWDAPLTAQPEQVRKFVEEVARAAPPDSQVSRIIGANGQVRAAITGDQFYKGLSTDIRKGRIVAPNGLTGDPAVSAMLLAAGVPGLRYLDAGSRTAGDGTRNYVIFDDSRIQITDVEQQVANPVAAVQLEPTETLPLPNIEKGLTGPIPIVVKAARAYAAAAGLPLRRQREYVKVDTARAARIAQAYADMQHEPADPAVQAAYKAMAEETLAQYQFVKATGLVIEPITDGVNPYNSPREVLADIANGHIWYFRTDDGFGSNEEFDPEQNPLLEATSEKDAAGNTMLVNDVFRVVHDFFGHGMEGSGFGPRGEENAWQSHMRLFSANAVPAMTSETRGQNSWVNYGPFGEQNRADPRNTVYADQKTGIMPSWTWQEGIEDSQAYVISAPVELEAPVGFPNSVVKTEVYHATDDYLPAFTPGRLAYFSSDKDGAGRYGADVMAFRINLTNPYVHDDTLFSPSEEFIADLKRKGHDGFVSMGEDEGETYYTVFDPEQIEFSDPVKRFREALQAAVDESKYGAVVKVYSPAKYAKMRLFLAPDGMSGFALDGEDIVSVFGRGGGKLRKIIDAAVANGGRTLDAFDTGLPKMYASLGFRETKREPWNPSYAPKDWPAELGTPDVVFMEYVGNEIEAQSAVPLRRRTETLEPFGLGAGRANTRQIAAALELRQQAQAGQTARDDRSPEAIDKIAKWMVEEVEFELQHPEQSGAGWYSEKFQRALDTFSDAYPELATDKNARDMLTLFIAITSDGQKVVPNFAQAIDIYGNYRSGKGLTTSRGHARQGSIQGNLDHIAGLLKELTPAELSQYLLTEDTVSNLKKEAAAKGVEFATKYQAHIRLPRAAIELGPKLGAFYSNLMGADGYLTMDRWWSRTFNRYRGDLLPRVSSVGLDRLRTLLGATNLTDEETIAATIPFRQSYEAKGFKEGTEIEKAANTIYKAAFEELNDTPFSSSDRTFMVDTVNRAREMLSEQGTEISVADIQAVLWYYEKRLYGELGARQSEDISYEEAARRVVAARSAGRDGPDLEGEAALDAGANQGTAEDIDRMTGTATARNPYLAEPTRPTRGIPTPQPDPGNQEDVRLSAISRNFVTILGLTARHGRLAARDSSVMGEYNRRTAAIRLRTWTDLSTLVHEGGHALNDSMAAPMNAFVQANLRQINAIAHKFYAGDLSKAPAETVRREGFAEFFRIYTLNPSYARNRWPQLVDAFEQTLKANDPKVLDGLNSISAQFDAWLQLPSRQLIRNMIVDGRRESGIDAAVKELRDRGFKGWMAEYARRATGVMINKYVSVAELEAQLLNLGEQNRGAPIDLQRSESPTAILRLARNSGSRAQVQITDGVIGYRSTQSTSRGLREALMTALGIPPDTTPASLDEELMKDFDAYLVARRAFDEYRRFDLGEIERPPIGAQKGDVVRTIKEYEQSQPQFAPAAQIVHEYGMAMWQKRYDAGLMDKETYEEGLQRRFYAPLQRDVSDKQGTGADSIGFGSSVLTKGPRFRGSDRDIISPMTVLMQMTFALEKQIAENDAKRALAVLADRAGQAGALVERIPASQLIGQSFSVQQVAARLTADAGLTAADASDLMTILAGSIEKGDLMTLFRSEQAGTQGENVIFFWENGKIAAIRLNDSSLASDVVNTMNAVGRENMDVMLEAVAATSTVFRTAITSWPDFLVVNYIRDQFSAWILGGTNYIPFATGFQGITDEIRQKQWAKSYNAAGGTLGGMTVASLHRARVDRDINALRAKGYTANVFGDANGGWSNVPGVIKGLGRLTALTETGTRLGLYRGAYERAIKDGLSEYDASVEAAYIATDYIDFGLNGSKMLTARRLIPFLNAQLQGLYKMVRTLGGDEVARRKGLGFALSAYFKNINNLPLSRLEQQQLRTGRAAWLKMMSLGLIGAALWAIFRDDPDYQEAGEYLRTTGWVIPTGDGKIFYIPKPFELAMVSNAVERGLELATGDTTAIDRFKRGVAFALTPPTAPPAIQSIVEVAANYDFFTGREIVPSYSQALAPQLQYDNYTSSIAKWVGGVTNQSPLVVDHILSGMGASAYRDISTMLNAADPSRPMPDETEWPILRRFVRDVRKGSASAQDFWAQASNTSGKLSRAAITYNDYMNKKGNQPAANRFLSTLSADERAYAVLMTDFKPEEKRLNPFYRARQVTGIVSDMRRQNSGEGLEDTTLTGDMSPAEIKAHLASGGELDRFPFSRGLRTQVDDILSEIARREVRNTLIATGQPGWTGKELLPLEPTLDMLLAVSPDTYDEYNRRRVKAKVYDAQSVYDYWPEVRDRLVSDGPDAVLSDAVAVAGVVF